MYVESPSQQVGAFFKYIENNSYFEIKDSEARGKKNRFYKVFVRCLACNVDRFSKPSSEPANSYFCSLCDKKVTKLIGSLEETQDKSSADKEALKLWEKYIGILESNFPSKPSRAKK